MADKHTDQKLLVKGLKRMAMALPLLFLSPYLITLSFLNKDNFMLYVFFIPGLLVGIGAVYLCFKGINLILKSIF